MDFFGLQDNRKKHSAILLVFFIAAMLAMAVVIHAIAVLVSLPSGAQLDLSQPSTPAKAFIVVIWLICLFGCLFRVLDVQAGGAALAKRFGAVEVNTSGRYRDEQVLLDIVNELSIASACSMPDVFVLQREKSINAFVVGGFSGDEALVVSQGAIEKLNRHELTAVVAHEYGHIAQGDIPLNMRLLVALGGLNAIDEVGKLILVRNDNQMVLHPGIIVGFVIRVIGSIGVFFGQIIRSAFSRQREYLADASAAQFTRSPEHLASALSIVRDQHDDVALHSVHSEELSHLCFQVGEKTHWYSRFFATHPPIQKRIDAIDPNFAVKQRSRKRLTQDNKPELKSVGNGVSAMSSSMTSSMSESMPMGGGAVMGVTGLSDLASMMLNDAGSCLAVLHAIFVSDDEAKRKEYYSAIAFAYNKVFSHDVKHVRETLGKELLTNQIGIIETATTQLRQSIKLENRQRLLKSLEKLLMVEGEFTLMNYATMQLIRRKLDADFPVLEKISDAGQTTAKATQVKTFDTMGSEFALLLSLMVESSGNHTQTIDEQFITALKCYTQEHHPRRSSDEAGIVKELESAFQTLYVQPQPIREAFVRHCLELAQADGHIASDERAMLDLFAASLNCDAIAA